jgi:RNA polymerase sigma-70 factor (ECF subfamily)
MDDLRDMSDADLARRSAAGDRDAFGELVRRYGLALAALVRRLVDDPHERDDVLQETLLQAWAGVRSLRNPEKVRQWLLQVARNRCRDAHGGRVRIVPEADPDQRASCMTRRGRDVERRAEARDRATEALSAVPEPQRESAELFYIQGFTVAEVARALGRPQGTVKRWLFDARRHMRRAAGMPERENRGRKERT